MNNIVAIAQKELRSYFASPIGYVVLAAFTFVFGFFYVAILNWFAAQSMQMGMGGMGGGPVNINQMMIRPLLQNVAVVVLFVLPLVTMRTYAEEKRSGTVELLLTSPVSDVQIILGKFLGALALYAVMLAVTFVHVGLLFGYATPEWKPIVSGYAGVLLVGATFIAMGLLVSSLTRSQIVAAVVTFSLALILWVVSWMADSAGPTMAGILNYVSITSHLDDFAKGVVDTKNLIYYLSLIAFWLFLTLRAVDSERWRG